MRERNYIEQYERLPFRLMVINIYGYTVEWARFRTYEAATQKGNKLKENFGVQFRVENDNQ